MSDFYQTDIITTLQARQAEPDRIEHELEGFTKQRPMTLVRPPLYGVQADAINGIVEELKKVRYVKDSPVARQGLGR
jgi:hypothetical protein